MSAARTICTTTVRLEGDLFVRSKPRRRTREARLPRKDKKVLHRKIGTLGMENEDSASNSMDITTKSDDKTDESKPVWTPGSPARVRWNLPGDNESVYDRRVDEVIDKVIRDGTRGQRISRVTDNI